jgi:hypothetical protein
MLSRIRAGGLEPVSAVPRPSPMHGTLQVTQRAVERRRSIKTSIIVLAVLAIAVGIVAGAVLVYTPLGDQLPTFLGFT